MDFPYKRIVIAKPKAYCGINVESAEALFKADQTVLSAIGESIIEAGKEQLQAKTGYTKDNLPPSSPSATAFTLDSIRFELSTTVRRNNPKYQTAYDKTEAFLEFLEQDWNSGIRREGIRTFPVKTSPQGEPFVEWQYLVGTVWRYIGEVVELGVENKFKKMEAPEELEKSLDRLVIPVKLLMDFDIGRPGAAALWYLADKFYQETYAQTVAPLKGELKERAAKAGTKEKPLAAMQEHWQEVADYLFKTQLIPSPRRTPGEILQRLFAVPEPEKEKGGLPTVINHLNYQRLLAEFKDRLNERLQSPKKLAGEVGELVLLHYGLQDAPRVVEEFGDLSSYQPQRKEGKLFVRLREVYQRMQVMEEKKAARLLTRQGAEPLAKL